MKRVVFTLLLAVLVVGGLGWQEALRHDRAFSQTASSTATDASQPSGHKNPTCVDNYTTWNSSTTYRSDAPWSPTFITSSNTSNAGNGIPQTQDLNGDGLPDYIYHARSGGGTCGTGVYYDLEESCVYLNNGQGWTKAYRCVVKCEGGNTVKFYGDCAG